jgi:sugar phosphate isomerase/epimerase
MTTAGQQPRLGFSPVAISQCPFEESVSLTAAAGFAGIALRYDKLEDYLARGHSIADVRDLLSRHGLAFSEGGFLAEWQYHGGVPLVCGRKRQGGPDEDSQKLLARYRTFLERCAELECSNLTASVALWDTGDLTVAAEDFAALCDVAHPYGAKIGLEFMGHAPQVKNIRIALDLILLANRPNGGLVIDTFFIHQSRSKLNDLNDVPVERIFNVQLADAKPKPVEQLNMLEDRLFPGEGAAPVRDAAQLLLKRGYAGWWNVELFNPDFRVMPPGAVARKAHAAATAIFDDLDTAA